MTASPTSCSSPGAISTARRKFIRRIAALPIKPAARDYYVRWAESWTKARGHQSPERTRAYFDALGRCAHVADWQFRQAVDAARVLACDVLAIPWASSVDWQRRPGHPEEVLVANPPKLRAIYSNNRKSDQTDARMIARLARVDPALLHPIQHGSEEAQRDLLQIKLRDNLVRQRVDII